MNLCSTCHGPRGISTSPEFPILAAQRPAYLVAQIENFQHKTREEKAAHDFMCGIAGNLLDPKLVQSIAAYYAAQPPAPGAARGSGADRVGQEALRNGASRSWHTAVRVLPRRASGRRRGLPASRGPAREVRGPPARVYPGTRAQGTRDARDRQGSHARRDGSRRRLRAIDIGGTRGARPGGPPGNALDDADSESALPAGGMPLRRFGRTSRMRPARSRRALCASRRI